MSAATLTATEREALIRRAEKCRNEAWAWRTSIDQPWSRAFSEHVAHTIDELLVALSVLEQQHADAEETLKKIAGQQQRVLGWLRANGIVFDGPLGTDPHDWQHVAFSIYTDLCEVDAWARAALAAASAAAEGDGG